MRHISLIIVIAALLVLPLCLAQMIGPTPTILYINPNGVADQNPLTLGGGWSTTTAAQGGMKLLSNVITNIPTGTGTNDGGYSWWKANSFQADQWIKAEILAMGGTANQADIGVHPRVTDAANFTGCEALQTNPGPLPAIEQVYLTSVVTTETPEAVFNATFSAGNTVKCFARGPVIEWFLCPTWDSTACPMRGVAIATQSSGTPEIHVWDKNATGAMKMGRVAMGNLAPLNPQSASDALTSSITASNNWTIQVNSFSVSSSAQKGSTSGDANSAFWAGSEFGPNQCAQTTIQALNGLTDGLGPAVDMVGSSISAGVGTTRGTQAYVIDAQTTTTGIFYIKILPGHPTGSVFTTLSTTSVTTSVGDTWKLCRAAGGALTATHNGSVVSALNATNTTITGGQPGIFQFGNVATQNTFVASPN